MLLLPQAWSLSLEILFYAIAPFVLKKKKTILIVFIFSFATRLILHLRGYSNDPFSYRFFPSEVSVFLLGAASWHLYRDHQIELVKKYLLPIQAGLCIVFVLWPYLFAFDDLVRYMFFVPFALFVPYLYNHYSNNSLDYKIGEMSYPFYLVHFVALQVSALFISKLFGKLVMGNVLVVILAFVITTVISIFLLRFVQGRVEKIRQNIVAKMKAQALTQETTDLPA
jgi:peptidoglycan/LPS O-acetylase OafA/YrhL